MMMMMMMMSPPFQFAGRSQGGVHSTPLLQCAGAGCLHWGPGRAAPCCASGPRRWASRPCRRPQSACRKGGHELCLIKGIRCCHSYAISLSTPTVLRAGKVSMKLHLNKGIRCCHSYAISFGTPTVLRAGKVLQQLQHWHGFKALAWIEGTGMD